MICCALYKIITTSGNKEIYFKSVVSMKRTIEKLFIYDTCAKVPLHFESARGLIARDITLDNVESDGESLVFWQDSDGYIDELTVKNSDINSKSIVKIGATSKFTQWGAKYFRINSLKLCSLRGIGESFKLFERSTEYDDTYYIRVDNYNVCSCENSEFLERFPTAGELCFTKKGEPVNEDRLCKYYSEKTDEALQKKLIWNGSQWC